MPERFLVLDDEVSYRENGVDIVNSRGHQAVEVGTNEAAVEELKSGGVIGVISDWCLRESYGGRMVYSLSTLEMAVGQNIPVLVSTGTDDSTGRLNNFQSRYLQLVTVTDKNYGIQPVVEWVDNVAHR